ncbi:hypothetical protein FC653_21480 [Vibrio vulnificus]|nr:hypothetical protein [Vibrio vulnificus]RZQ33833.1 hypothetical protein D8T41_21785 [Vibrio vulnificus]HAS8241647.1 hypothetical protein [Vibrio vulnificus]HAS8371834.1 hypothetical protein [Vibrio vulnificus]HAS8494889.1 hypothetical protein [Vibrio vulnificus]
MSFFNFSFWANEAHLFFVFEVVCTIETTSLAENLLGEFVVSKAEFLAEMTFSLACEFMWFQ